VSKIAHEDQRKLCLAVHPSLHRPGELRACEPQSSYTLHISCIHHATHLQLVISLIILAFKRVHRPARPQPPSPSRA
jgi:hypothetical protein